MTKFTKFAVAAAFAFGFVSIASAATVTVPPNLMQGSMGQEVMDMQSILGITADGNFGPMTKASVMAFQSANGLTADGVVGAMTAAKLNAVGTTTGGATETPGCPAGAMYNYMTGAACGTTTGGDDNGNDNNGSGDFDGTEGSVKSIEVGSPDQSDIAENQEEREVVAIDVELESDGDLQLDRADFYFEVDDSTTASAKPWDYFDKAYFMVDGDIVSEMDVSSSSDWTDYSAATPGHVANGGTNDKEYRLRFDDFEAMLASDETTTVAVAFDAASSIDSDDETADWNWAIEDDSFRFTDGTGFIFTDGNTAIDDSFSIANEDVAELKISAASDDPKDAIVEVDDSSDTNDVEIAVVNIEEKQGVDATIDEITVEFTTGTEDVSTVLNKAYLYDGNDLIGSESVTGAGTTLSVTFDNLDFSIDADDEVDLSVKVDIDDTDDQTRYVDGETIEVSDFDITDATDEFDNDADLSGSFTGNTFTLNASGISAELVSVSQSATTGTGNNDDIGTFTIKFKVTAFGDTVYIPDVAQDTGTTGILFDVDRGGTNESTGLSATLVDSTDSDLTAGGNFDIEDGETEQFTLTVAVDNGTIATAGLYRAVLANIRWNTTDSAVAYTGFTTNLDDFKTDYISLN